MDKRTILLLISATLSNKIFLLKCTFLPICNNFSGQNCLDKPIFNNVSTLNHSSPINNTVTNKIKHFPQLFVLSPQITLKRKCHYFLY